MEYHTVNLHCIIHQVRCQRRILSIKLRAMGQRWSMPVSIVMVRITEHSSVRIPLTWIHAERFWAKGNSVLTVWEKEIKHKNAVGRMPLEECRSKNTCQLCGNRHRASNCDWLPGNSQMMMVTGGGSVIYPVVVIVVDGIKCRALLETVTSSWYGSAALVGRLNKQPVCTEHRQIEMILGSTTQKVQSYEVKVAESVELTRVCYTQFQTQIMKTDPQV